MDREFFTSSEIVSAALYTGLGIFILCVFMGIGWSLFTSSRREAQREGHDKRMAELVQKQHTDIIALATHVAIQSGLTGEALEAKIDELFEKYTRKAEAAGKELTRDAKR